MKSLLRSSIFLAVLLFSGAGSPVGCAQSIPVDQDNAHKAKVLLDQMVEALGGQAYLSIEDISQEGRTYSFYHGQANSLGIVFWRFYKYPDKDRIELTKKRDVIELFNGPAGYEITYKGTHAADPKDLADVIRRRQFSLDWVVRRWLSEPGVALFYNGPSVAANKPADQVSILNARNQGVTLDIDSSTHLPLKKSYSWRDPTDQQRNTEDELYDAYRAVQGIMTPFSITRFYNGEMSNQRFISSVSYNQGLADAKFDAQITYGPKPPVSTR
jgi:hypothetical protein